MGKLLSIAETERKFGSNRNHWKLLIALGLIPKANLPGKAHPMLDEDDVQKFIDENKDQEPDPRYKLLLERLK